MQLILPKQRPSKIASKPGLFAIEFLDIETMEIKKLFVTTQDLNTFELMTQMSANSTIQVLEVVLGYSDQGYEVIKSIQKAGSGKITIDKK